ncbi:hypothetical protein ELI49_21890 [Rhizobium ruizarguesonis]|nr:hypothetical protein [Rhizobium ruizarguesonis]TCA28731.1 hypothetical protein E0H70_19815 [Rhizobium leguminosarum bv. viciae]NEH64321.1 hypothetical protein [Rhizobium ruizarguesonis]NEH78771.1 hypothetical protein [Rhizobium ruizarguesonis]NEI21377.1 hypothetical protein [Rhizobium ruizarguesonis]
MVGQSRSACFALHNSLNRNRFRDKIMQQFKMLQRPLRIRKDARRCNMESPAPCERRAFFSSADWPQSASQSIAWISLFFVSGRKIRPITSVIDAKTIGYQRP